MRIKNRHALYLSGWQEGGDEEVLKSKAEIIYPLANYMPKMKGHLFCPMCKMRVMRKPQLKDKTSKGVDSHFAHFSRGASKLNCDWRSTKIEGKKYASVEEAHRAVENGGLIIIAGFQKNKPEGVEKTYGNTKQAVMDGMPGPDAQLAITRKIGEVVTLPSIMTSVLSLCRNFKENLTRHIVLPGESEAYPLIDLLHDAMEVVEADGKPRLYYAKILNFWPKVPGNSTSQRSVMLKESYNLDFELCDTWQNLQDKSINESAKGRVVLAYGVATGYGKLRIEQPGWGEYALLPEEYTELLYPKK